MKSCVNSTWRPPYPGATLLTCTPSPGRPGWAAASTTCCTERALWVTAGTRWDAAEPTGSSLSCCALILFISHQSHRRWWIVWEIVIVLWLKKLQHYEKKVTIFQKHFEKKIFLEKKSHFMNKIRNILWERSHNIKKKIQRKRCNILRGKK